MQLRPLRAKDWAQTNRFAHQPRMGGAPLSARQLCSFALLAPGGAEYVTDSSAPQVLWLSASAFLHVSDAFRITARKQALSAQLTPCSLDRLFMVLWTFGVVLLPVVQVAEVVRPSSLLLLLLQLLLPCALRCVCCCWYSSSSCNHCSCYCSCCCWW